MAEWTHRVCERDWFDSDLSEHSSMPGAFRMPTQVKDVEPGLCCVCGGLCVTGIFIRKQQDDVLCQGRHEESQWHEWARVALSEPPPVPVVQGGLS